MRTHSIYVVLLALLGIWACEQKVDVATEKEAIKVAIQHEKDTFRTPDYEGYAASWVHAPYISHAGFREGLLLGWDSLRVVAKNLIETMKKEPDKHRIDELTTSNFDIHLNGNIAFVMCDMHFRGTFYGEPASHDGKQLTYLVEKDGEWKLVAMFIM